MHLVLVTQDFPPDVGGTQTYAYELAHRFSSWCDAFAVVAPRVDGSEAFDRSLPFEVIRLAASYDLMFLRAWPTLVRLGARFDAAFHVQWSTALASLAACPFGGPPHTFVAAHGRELLLRPLPHPLLNRTYDAARSLALTRADGLFPVSSYTADLLRRAGATDARITVVHNGTDPHRFRPMDASELRQRLGLADRKVILTVGRLVARKGIDTVLRALPRVRRAVPEVAYLVVGNGPDRGRLEALARSLCVSDRVHFTGRVPDEVLPLYYNACDVFAMPSRFTPPRVEGFGIVFLEANACGKPVIGARSGGIPDAIQDSETGLLVPPNDPATLAEQLVRLFQNPAWAQQLGSAGRDYVTGRATWDHAAAQVYESMRRQLPA